MACSYASNLVPRLILVMASHDDSSLVTAVREICLLLASAAPFIPAMLLGCLMESLHDQASRSNDHNGCQDPSMPTSGSVSLSCSLELLLALLSDAEAARSFMSAVTSLDQEDPLWIRFIQSHVTSPDPKLARASGQIMLFTIRSCTPRALQSFGGSSVQIVSQALADLTACPEDEHHAITLREIMRAVVESGVAWACRGVRGVLDTGICLACTSSQVLGEKHFDF
jgi:hypothetical protein